jgi:7-cyano-7-deazaguanine synthase
MHRLYFFVRLSLGGRPSLAVPAGGSPVTRKAVVLLSGGLDSTVLMYSLLFEDFEVVALSVRYGQKHERELVAARVSASTAKVPLVHVDAAASLFPVFEHATSSQVGTQGIAVPHGHYADESMKLTVVPNRNMLLLSIAGALAASIGARTVAYAAHAGDHPIYPDCRPEFMAAASDALRLGSQIDLYAPFANISKTDIVRRGSKLRIPFDLTYSCYEGRPTHCGLCGTCFERREAFREAGVPDPTPYEAQAA